MVSIYFNNRQAGVSVAYIAAHFSKRNIILDLENDEERDIALRLVETSDTLIENLQPGTMNRLGVLGIFEN